MKEKTRNIKRKMKIKTTAVSFTSNHWWLLVYLLVYLLMATFNNTQTERVTGDSLQKQQDPHLEGLWMGNYGSHGPEVVHITVSERWITATKVTGDVNVPAGEVTWRVSAHSLTGQVHCAWKGFRDDWWEQCTLLIIDRDTIQVNWNTSIPHEEYDLVFYRIK